MAPQWSRFLKTVLDEEEQLILILAVYRQLTKQQKRRHRHWWVHAILKKTRRQHPSGGGLSHNIDEFFLTPEWRQFFSMPLSALVKEQMATLLRLCQLQVTNAPRRVLKCPEKSAGNQTRPQNRSTAAAAAVPNATGSVPKKRTHAGPSAAAAAGPHPDE